MKKYVLIITAHHEPAFDEFKKVWVKSLNVLPPEVRPTVLFSYGSSPSWFRQNPSPRVEQSQKGVADIIVTSCDEIECVLPNTLGALQEALRDPDWTYVVKTTLSTWYHLPSLQAWLECLPEEKVYAGCHVGSGGPNPIISGTGTILSRDVVETLLKHQSELLYDWKTYHDPDDVVMWKHMNRWFPQGWVTRNLPRLDVLEGYQLYHKGPEPFVYRFKSRDRRRDAYLMKVLTTGMDEQVDYPDELYMVVP